MAARDPRSIIGKPNAGVALDFFRDQGWSPEQASGIVANLFGENDDLDPGLGQQPSGPGYGIAQWEKPRQQNFQAWAGKPIQGSSLQDQLGFVQHEIRDGSRKGAGLALDDANDPAKAALAVMQHYEQPKDSASDSPTAVFRMRAAQALYDAYFPADDQQPRPVAAQPVAPPSITPQSFPMPRLST